MSSARGVKSTCIPCRTETRLSARDSPRTFAAPASPAAARRPHEPPNAPRSPPTRDGVSGRLGPEQRAVPELAGAVPHLVEVDVLGLHVLEDALQAELAPDAALLVA